MEPPPPPSSGRFRLRVQIYPPQDVHNLSAAPLRQFTIVKTPVLPLPNLTLQRLCQEVVHRFQAIYPTESLFSIDRPQDSYGSDLYLGDRVQDVFEDNEVFRVIKGASMRASVEPHRARSRSVQPTSFVADGSASVRKRKPEGLRAEDHLPAEKRQRISPADPDSPIISCERDSAEREFECSGDYLSETTVIMNSQESASTRGQAKASGIQVRPQGQQSTPLSRARDGFEPHEIHPIETHTSKSDKVSATLAREVISPPSVGSSKDGAINSGSDANSSFSRNLTSSRRKIQWIEEPSDQERAHSTSTAITTPPSVAQQSDANSPAIDSKKLKRPQHRIQSEGHKVFKSVPRSSPYDDFRTDDEAPSVKLPTRSVSSKVGDMIVPVGVSLKKFLSRPPNSLDSRASKSSPTQQVKEIPKPRVSTYRETERAVPELEKSSNLEMQRITEQQNRSRLAARAVERRLRVVEKDEKQLLDMLEQKAHGKNVDIQARRIMTTGPRLDIDTVSIADSDFGEERINEEESPVRQTAAQPRRKEQAQGGPSLREKLVDSMLSKEKTINEAAMEGKKPHQQEDETVVRHPSSQLSHTHQRLGSPLVAPRNIEAISKSLTASATPIPSTKRPSCTPFIPRGRPSGLNSIALLSSQAIASPSPSTSLLSVGLEAQMPLPPHSQRRVSFADQPVLPRHRSSSTSTNASFNLRQTTLVPPRLGITDVKSKSLLKPQKMTPSSSTSSKSSKGKAKVVESPGKPPAAPIIISLSKEPSQDMIDVGSWTSYSTKVGQPGPAYQKYQRQAREKVTESELVVVESKESEAPELRTGNTDVSAEIKRVPSGPSRQRSTTNSSSPGRGTSRLQVLITSVPAVGLSALVNDRADHIKTLESKAEAPTVSQDTSQDGDEGDESDDEPSDEEEDFSATRKPITPISKSTGDQERMSVDTQGQVDDQLTQSIRSSSPSKSWKSAGPSSDEEEEEEEEEEEAEDVEEEKYEDEREEEEEEEEEPPLPSVLKSPDVDEQQRQSLSQRMPSLRRMNQEAQRTKEAALEVAKARGLVKAQQMRDEARRKAPQAISDGEYSSSSDGSSSESDSDEEEEEDDDDDVGSVEGNKGGKVDRDKVVTPILPPTRSRRAANAVTTTTTKSSNLDNLDNENIEDIRQELFAKIGGLDVPGLLPSQVILPGARTSIAKSGKKGQPGMGKEVGETENGKKPERKSSRLDLAKLAKKFAPVKQRGGRVR